MVLKLVYNSIEIYFLSFDLFTMFLPSKWRHISKIPILSFLAYLALF